MSIFSMLDDMHIPDAKDVSVSMSQYSEWRAGFVFEAIRNRSYGQSFCAQFNIDDKILLHNALNMPDADRYIRRTYVR